MITKTDEKPASGQFAAVWRFNGKIWAGVFKWVDGGLTQYQEFTDTFEPEDFPYPSIEDITYFVETGDAH